MEEQQPVVPNRKLVAKRIGLAITIALATLLGAYMLLEATQPDNGLVSFTFLLVLPVGVAAFISYVADPLAKHPMRFHLKLNMALMAVVIVTSIVLLREGVVCVIILAPLWFGLLFLGSWLTVVLRRGTKEPSNRVHASALLLLPFLVLQAEPYLPYPQTTATVTRSIIAAAPPEKIWYLLEGIPDVREGEGRWNLSQDLIGIPRPVGAHLVGSGIGAARYARWGMDIRFREVVTHWQPGRELAWKFVFDDVKEWAFTDRHLMPDSPYFRITTGGYTLQRLGGGKTRVTLNTSYWMQTPVNDYSALWGEFFLGDVENNLLALIKQRAEGGTPQPSINQRR